jgi:hypothetical protein
MKKILLFAALGLTILANVTLSFQGIGDKYATKLNTEYLFAGTDQGTLYGNSDGTKYCCCSGTNSCSAARCSNCP